MSSLSDDAVKMFADGYNCAQSVLATCGEPLGLLPATAIAVAQAFGGGVARSGHVCGALTGALMAVGLKCSAQSAKDKPAKEEALKLAQEILSRFRGRHQAINCRELLGYDLSKPEERGQAAEAGVFGTICPGLVRSAVEIVEDVLGID